MAERERAPRILIADDEANARLLARLSLERVGAEVIEAADGNEAIARAAEGVPDLVLLDVVMPGPNGFQVCAKMREDPAWDTVPIVMMTALEDLASVDRAYAAGATDFIPKPVNWALLQHRARFILRAARNVEKLVESEERLAEAQRIAGLGSWEWNLDDGSFGGSAELWAITGGTADEVPTIDAFTRLADANDRRTLTAIRRRAIAEREPYEIEYRLQLRDGTRHVIERAEVLVDDGVPRFLVGTLHDVTERREIAARIHHMTHTDPLTGLANRRALEEQIDSVQERGNGVGASLIHIDIGQQERILEALGHEVADSFVATVGAELERILGQHRRFSGAVAARLQTDQFAVLIPHVSDPLVAQPLAGLVASALSTTLAVEGHEWLVSARVGLVTIPDDGDSASALLRRAQTAACSNPAQRGGTVSRYSEDLETVQRRQLTLESELYMALERDEFSLRYQPIVRVSSTRMHAVEVLIRWHNGKFGLVGPDRFIPLAEELGLIEDIGAWVLCEACLEGARWHQLSAAAPKVAVNLSAHQLKPRANLPAMVEKALESTGLPASGLELEITEGLLVEQPGQVIPTLLALREMGVSISLDDFGTGFSSLSYLTRFPIDTLKIDKTFLAGIPGRRRDESLVRAIITLAHGLGLEVITEGVETGEQLGFLAQHGSDYAQGYLMSKPVEAPEIRPLVAAGAPLLEDFGARRAS